MFLGISSDNIIVSESGEKVDNVGYKGLLENRQWIAVKKFTKIAWPDPEQFKEEALRRERLANLIGFFHDGDERLLVAECMLKDTLAKHLFNWGKQTIGWAMRLRVSILYKAEAFDYCNFEDRVIYQDLNAYKVFFDEALDIIRDRNLTLLMDSHLEGKFSTEEATKVVGLASQFLQYEPGEWHSTKDLVVTLASLQTKPHVPSYVMLRISKHEEAPSTPQSPLSPLSTACSRMDLAAIHQILVMALYKDDKETNELSFQEWIHQMRDMLEAKKHGNTAFRDKEFKTAIDYYSQVPSYDMLRISKHEEAPSTLFHHRPRLAQGWTSQQFIRPVA